MHLIKNKSIVRFKLYLLNIFIHLLHQLASWAGTKEVRNIKNGSILEDFPLIQLH